MRIFDMLDKWVPHQPCTYIRHTRRTSAFA